MIATMIQIFSIFCKLNQISLSDRQWVEKETESLLSPDHACPVCHAHGSLSPFASYTRCLVEREKGKPAVHEIVIKRFQCRSCGHTHARVSSALVPYSSYSLRFILQTLRDYFLGRACVQYICDRAGIAVSTLYRWKNLFIRHKALWMEALKELHAARPVEFVENMDGHFLQNFYQTFLLSFLQSRHSGHPESSPGEVKTPSAAT
ncbi:MAG TPA: hypothetical protein DF613_10550 [Lachnospiraceae bacterium]|nr:hypothetical protein [Lachnospiraceae bacterium]